MNQYNIHRVIGKGAEGTVYEVSDDEGKRFAMKRTLLLPDQQKGVALLNGIDIQRSITHPYIVPILKILSEQDIGDFLIIYPLALDSLDVAIYETEIDLSPDHIVRFMWEIANGLAYLHHNGIIHRDLKAANILIFEEGDHMECKITDFGLAKYHITNQVNNTLPIVTVNYRAPELFDKDTRNAQNYGFEVDIWSLGCIFYELIFRKVMIKGHTDEECLNAVNSFKLPDVRDNHDIRLWLDQYKRGTFDQCMILLAKMLDFNTKNRPTIDDILESPVFEDFEPISSQPIYKNYEFCFSPNPYRKEGIMEIAKTYEKHTSDLRALRTMYMAIDLFDRALNDKEFEHGSKSQIHFLAHACNILANRYYCLYKINNKKIANRLSDKFKEEITELSIRTTQSYIFENYALYRETLFDRLLKGLECRLSDNLEHAFGYKPFLLIYLFVKMSYTFNYQSHHHVSDLVLDITIENLENLQNPESPRTTVKSPPLL